MGHIGFNFTSLIVCYVFISMYKIWHTFSTRNGNLANTKIVRIKFKKKKQNKSNFVTFELPKCFFYPFTPCPLAQFFYSNSTYRIYNQSHSDHQKHHPNWFFVKFPPSLYYLQIDYYQRHQSTRLYYSSCFYLYYTLKFSKSFSPRHVCFLVKSMPWLPLDCFLEKHHHSCYCCDLCIVYRNLDLGGL